MCTLCDVFHLKLRIDNLRLKQFEIMMSQSIDENDDKDKDKLCSITKVCNRKIKLLIT